MTERLAIIDLGSNSARLIVMHIYSSGAYNLVYHQKETVRLSEGLGQSGLLQPRARERALNTLKGFAHMAQLFNVDKTLAVATAAVRNAKNGQEFMEQVRRETAIAFKIISGESEAHLGFLGVINTIAVENALLFDLGGGSTELTLIKNRKAEKVISLPIGAVNLTERFGTIGKYSETKLTEMSAYIQRELQRVPWLKNLSLPLIGVGGTARNIAKMDQKPKNYPLSRVHNYRLSSMAFEELWKDLTKTTLTQRRKYPGLSSERADIIIPGVSIVKGLFDITKGSQMIISGCGVREGLFLQYYFARKGQPEVIPDILAHSTHNMLLFYLGDTKHAQHVANLARSLFNGWQEKLALSKRDKTLLQVAALLHDIGITINYYDHARHSAYLVENARIFGLTHREQMLAAVVAGWHNGIASKYVRNKLYSEFLDEADWQIARKLAILLSLAESLDTTQMHLVKKVTASLSDNKARLHLDTAEPAPIEREAVRKYAKWFKKELGIELLIQ